MSSKSRTPSNTIEPRPAEAIEPTAVYTYAEAGPHLRMSERSVSKLVHAGRIGHVELNGKQWRILGRQILEYLARQERGPIR